jgi:hypothetical protein
MKFRGVMLAIAIGLSGCVRSEEPAPSSDSNPEDEAEMRALKAIKSLGGWAKRDETRAGRPYAVFLQGSVVTDAALKEIAPLKNIATLTLARSEVTDAGAKELARFKSLTGLSLAHTRITDAGLKELAALKGLKSLVLAGDAISETALAEFKSALPNCTVRR